MNPKQRAIMISLFTAGVGLIGGIELLRNQPGGGPVLAWSVWAVLGWMCFGTSIYGLGTLADILNPGWDKEDPFDEDS